MLLLAAKPGVDNTVLLLLPHFKIKGSIFRIHFLTSTYIDQERVVSKTTAQSHLAPRQLSLSPSQPLHLACASQS